MNPDSNTFQPGAQPANPAPAGSTPPTPPLTPQPTPAQPTESAPASQPLDQIVVPDAEPATPLESDVLSVAPEPPKKKNTARIVLIMILVLAIIGCGVAAAIMLMNPPKSGSPSGNNGDPTSNPDIPDAPVEPEETEVTDALLKKELDEKIAILHHTTQIEQTIDKGTVVGGYSNAIFDMYKTGYLDSNTIRISYIIDSLKSDFRSLSTEERDIVINSIPQEYREMVKEESLQGIDGDKVATKYKGVFGEELVHETSDECYTYRYDSTHNFYYQDPTDGCGGTSPYATFHYKNKYTTSGDNAYVYVSTALVDWEHGNVYCDIASLDLTNEFKLADDAEVCTTLPADDVLFVLDESNYENYSQYRFIFNKAEDGTYYFSEVEKL